MEFFRKANINFVGAMKGAFILSAILVLGSLGVLIARGGPRLGIDFTGGSVVQVRITPQTGIGDVRSVLERSGYGGAQVQDMAGTNEYLITFREANATTGVGSGATMLSALRNGLSGREIELRREESVGPKIGSELRSAAANAVFLSLVLIVVYMWFRFVFRYGIAAILALVHDVTITLGLFAVLDLEVSLPIIAAFLTIIGYSLNDTIVVFDRIRENMKLRRKESYREVINRSINETLSRTILTSATTLAATLSLWLLGGPVIHDFAFAMTFGILIGTYSSIFIASPILVYWYERFILDRKRVQPSM
jgi:preprotein translocase subunit SecF